MSRKFSVTQRIIKSSLHSMFFTHFMNRKGNQKDRVQKKALVLNRKNAKDRAANQALPLHHDPQNVIFKTNLRHKGKGRENLQKVKSQV